MKKPSKGTHDPHEIFLHAYHFHECDHRLRKGPSSKDIEEVALIAHPSMVLSAFASELYLKRRYRGFPVAARGRSLSLLITLSPRSSGRHS
jgi:hypothetical protein